MADYINREAAKEAFGNADADVCESYPDGHCDWGFGRSNIKDVIDGVPAADVEPVRHGWWETFDSSYWRSTQYGVQAIDCVKIRCGLCGRGSAVRTNYCPNCGSKMDLEE